MLDETASWLAMRTVGVRCYTNEEEDSPWSYGAWGYVFKPTGQSGFAHIDQRLCDGALAINDESLPEWQRALGVGVITHEAYHLRRWSGNQDEGKVECKAIRHWKVVARHLGASEETVEDIWPTAVAIHYRVAEYKDLFGNRPYYDPSCEVPPVIPQEELDG